jgi:hypothetical protein
LLLLLKVLLTCWALSHLSPLKQSTQVEWKLTRGKTRPRLLDYAKQAPPSAVEAASTAAFDLLAVHRGKEVPAPVVKQALAALTVLKVGCALLGMAVAVVVCLETSPGPG